MKSKLILFLIFFILISSAVLANVLVSTTIDKESIAQNQVARLNVKIFNNSIEPINNYPIRIELTDTLVFTNYDQRILADMVDEIPSGAVREINYNFKAVNTSENMGRLFVYYGENKEFVSGTFVNIESIPVLFNSNARKVVDSGGEKVMIDFEVLNYSREMIFDVGAEVIAPDGFDVKTQGFMIPYLEDNNSLKKTFEIIAPLNAVGEYRFILAYGYFDQNSPRYFEESHYISFEDNNRFFLAGIGFIVLIIAVFIYLSKSNAPKDGLKGTNEKSKDE